MNLTKKKLMQFSMYLPKHFYVTKYSNVKVFFKICHCSDIPLILEHSAATEQFKINKNNNTHLGISLL